MGMIATITPGGNSSYNAARVNVATDNICSIGHVNIQYFASDTKVILSLSYPQLPALNADDPSSAPDDLWKVSRIVKTDFAVYPNG